MVMTKGTEEGFFSYLSSIIALYLHQTALFTFAFYFWDMMAGTSALSSDL